MSEKEKSSNVNSENIKLIKKIKTIGVSLLFSLLFIAIYKVKNTQVKYYSIL